MDSHAHHNAATYAPDVVDSPSNDASMSSYLTEAYEGYAASSDTCQDAADLASHQAFQGSSLLQYAPHGYPLNMDGAATTETAFSNPYYGNTYQPDFSPAPLQQSPSPGSITSEEITAGRRLSQFALPPETQIPKTHYNYSKGASLSLPSTPILPSKARPSLSASAKESSQGKLQKSANKSTDKTHRCGDCKASFNRYHDLKRHQILHQDTKPFQCPICDKEFARREAIKRHFVAKPCGKQMTPEQEKAALKGRPRPAASRENSLSEGAASPLSPVSAEEELQPDLSSSMQLDPEATVRVIEGMNVQLSEISFPPSQQPSEATLPAPPALQRSTSSHSEGGSGASGSTEATPPLISPSATESSDASGSSGVPPSIQSGSSHTYESMHAFAAGHYSSAPPSDSVAAPLTSFEAAKWYSSHLPALARPSAPLMSPETAYALSYPKMYLPSPEEYPSSPNDPPSEYFPTSDYFNSKSNVPTTSSRLRFYQQQWD